MKIDNTDNDIYKISGEISIFNISEFYDSLKKLVNKNKVYLDLSEVSSIDTSGVQVILSFKKTGIKYKKDFRIIKPSNEVKKTLKILGVM
ncbi:MAG: STAS domain-containing protein [Spirochaetota bacterium]